MYWYTYATVHLHSVLVKCVANYRSVHVLARNLFSAISPVGWVSQHKQELSYMCYYKEFNQTVWYGDFDSRPVAISCSCD